MQKLACKNVYVLKALVRWWKPTLTATHVVFSMLVNNKLILISKKKANTFFVQQCQPVVNDSILSTNQMWYTHKRLRDFDTDSK